MPLTTYDFVAGDTGSELVVQCRSAQTKLPIDLTGLTATLRFKIGIAGLIEQAMTIDTPLTAGIVRYRFQSGELIAGRLVAAVFLTNTSTNAIVTQLDTFIYNVRENIL